MSTKRNPSALNEADLYKIIEENENNVEVASIQTNDIFTFFTTFGLETGTTPIKKNLLYSIYKAWSQYPMLRKDFINEVSNFITSNSHGYFLINQNALKLTYDVYKKFKSEKKKTVSKNWARHFEDFLNFHALTQGEFWIQIDIFYFLYDKYTFTRKIKPLKRDDFEKFCDVYLKCKITGNGKVYGVTDNVQNFFQEGQLERMKKTYGKEEKKKVKKRKSKTSRSRQKVQLKN